MEETNICDFNLSLDFTTIEGKFVSILVYFGTQDEFMKNGYLLFVEGNKLAFGKYVDGIFVEKASKLIVTSFDQEYNLALSNEKGEVYAKLNGETITANLGSDFQCGFIGLGNDNSKIKIENFKIEVLSPKKFSITQILLNEKLEKYVIVLPGNSSWTKTGIFIDQNDKVKINATGTIYYCPLEGCEVNPEGGQDIIKYPDKALCSTAPDISLIGKINNSCFEIGTLEEFTNDSNGELELAVNDGYLPGNTGSFNITIDINKFKTDINEDQNQKLVPYISDIDNNLAGENNSEIMPDNVKNELEITQNNSLDDLLNEDLQNLANTFFISTIWILVILIIGIVGINIYIKKQDKPKTIIKKIEKSEKDIEKEIRERVMRNKK